MNDGLSVPNMPATLFLRVKWRLAMNYLTSIRKHLLVHIVVGVAVTCLLFFGGLYGFSFLFNFLLKPEQQPFGEPLLKRLVGMVMLAFFSMLTFSNLIIMLTTSYISREVEFYMAQPLAHRRLFFLKFAESTLYSSWAFIVLSLPFFIALGGTREADLRFNWGTVLPDAPVSFYPITALLVLPFILIPASMGALIALVITVYFPTRRMFRLAGALAVVTVLLGIITGHQAGSGLRLGVGERAEITRVMGFMGIGDLAWMPSTWLGRGIRAAMEADYPEVLFHAGLLYSTAMMAVQICFWLAGPLYYRGFCSSRGSSSSNRRRAGGFFLFFDRICGRLPSPIRALVVKDLSVFWRDPAQWGQLMVLFGLLFIYIVNLGSASEISKIQVRVPAFRSLTSLFNIGATCFILAILTTRFFFPMLSLEGKQQWVIGLAPLPRTRLVWTKFGLCWVCSLLLCLPLVFLSCSILNTDAFITLLSIVTIVFMSMGLNSLAIGLGALMPNFQEDNPARIANGIGGTINVILSLIYIAASMALELPLVNAHIQKALPASDLMRLILYASIPAWLFFQLLVISLPLWLGLRHWRRLEF